MCTVGGRIGWIVTRSGTARRPGIPGTTTPIRPKSRERRACPIHYSDAIVSTTKLNYGNENKIIVRVLAKRRFFRKRVSNPTSQDRFLVNHSLIPKICIASREFHVL